MESDLLVIVGIIVGVITGSCGVLFAVLNYQYKKHTDNLSIKERDKVRLAKELEDRILEKVAIEVKEEMRDFVEMSILEVKRELASAVKLIDKDIFFLNQILLGRNTKSVNPMLEEQDETQEHKDMVEVGIFKPTDEEIKERESGDFSTQEDTNL